MLFGEVLEEVQLKRLRSFFIERRLLQRGRVNLQMLLRLPQQSPPNRLFGLLLRGCVGLTNISYKQV